MRVTMWVHGTSVSSSFEKCLSKTVSNSMNVIILHPSPCVQGWIMHLLSGMVKHGHGRVWCLRKPGWMDVRDVVMRWSTHGLVPNGCVRASLDGRCVPRHGMTSRCMNRIVGNRDDNEMRCDCVAHDWICSRTNLDSTQAMFGGWRQTLPRLKKLKRK